MFDTVISRTVRFPETTVAGEPITSWAPTSAGARPTGSWPARCSRALQHDVGMNLSAEDAVEIEALAITPVDAGLDPMTDEQRDDGAFRVRLDNFEGPFDLLLTPDLAPADGRHRGRAVPGHRRVHRPHPPRR